jgi:isocitrate dehydrogenase
MNRKIAVAKGDGIGPEIMDAVLRIFEAAGVPLAYEFVEMGKSIFDQGHSTGMTAVARETVEDLGILFKGPMETPKGSGVKSINVTARKVWNTYANKRVFKSLEGVNTVYSKAGIPIDMIIVRENIEDTYGGIEHMLTPDVALCRRFITRPGSLQVHRYAFEMARRNDRKRVTCGHKANIMKMTDGLFLETFYEVAKDYPEIIANDVIVDDLAMKLVVRPHEFDVVVLPNLQGDIISDLCAGLVGGLGFAPSANVGDNISIFEAVHGTAPDIMGKKLANPTALYMSGLMMLRHLNLKVYADNLEQALFKTLADGIHTRDFGTVGSIARNTDEFADAIIARLATTAHPAHPEVALRERPLHNKVMEARHVAQSTIAGADFFLESNLQPAEIADRFQAQLEPGMQLVTMSNRGTQVWPVGSIYTECINQFRLRLEWTATEGTSQQEILRIAGKIATQFKLCSIEWLMTYDGKKAYSLAQGQ